MECNKHIEAETKWPPFSKRHFQGIFSNENVWIWIKMSLKLVPMGPINNIPVLVQIMACHRPDNNPVSEPIVVRMPIIGKSYHDWRSFLI